MKNAIINGTGSYLPHHVLTNHQLEERLNTTHDWIFSRTGISSRHIASPEETTSFMACEAAKESLKHSTITAEEIDLILVATCTPNHFFPSMACHVQHALKLKNAIPAFDISAACSGFMYGIDIAYQYIRAGNATNILVVGSESMSRALNWDDRSTCVLFGDGAGAVILSAHEKPGVLASKIHAAFDEECFLTYPQTYGLEKIGIGMRGNEVFKLAVNIMGDIVDEILEAAHLKQSDITWLVPHQANIRIIQGIAKKLNLPMSQVIVTLEKQGNTSAASIPLALDYSIKTQRIKRGDLLLLESFGGGMTWGSAIIQY